MGSNTIRLKGITWDHSRGYTSAIATAQRFHELYPNIEISWDKRSLQAFADEPLDVLAQKYDLLIIDHPWAGFAARTGIILPLDTYLPYDLIMDLSNNSVGKSNESYFSDGHQWAMAIDAAAPVASSRPDLLRKGNSVLPKNFDDLLLLADAGLVIMPGIPQDTLMNFYMMCCTLGEDVCMRNDIFVSNEIGISSLKMLRLLASKLDPEFYNWNPIQVYEAMTQSDEFAYCPWAYGYSNYSRIGYSRKLLHFHDTIEITKGRNTITTLGGTGLSISAQTNHLDVALKYVEYMASDSCQKTLYFDNGGQPGHLKAWQDRRINEVTSDFFKNTLPTLERAFLRPRYNGHMYFQDRAGLPICDYMMNGGDEMKLMTHLNDLYIRSLNIEE